MEGSEQCHLTIKFKPLMQRLPHSPPLSGWDLLMVLLRWLAGHLLLEIKLKQMTKLEIPICFQLRRWRHLRPRIAAASLTDLVFGWEPVARLLEEPNLDEMLRAHWEELSAHKEEMPLDVDYQRLVDYDDQGIYRVWTARDGDTLVGYIAFYVYVPPHHRRTLIAVDDGYYLDPAHRRGWVGVRMWRAALDALAQLGVIGVIGHHKLHFQKSAWWHRRNLSPSRV